MFARLVIKLVLGNLIWLIILIPWSFVPYTITQTVFTNPNIRVFTFSWYWPYCFINSYSFGKCHVIVSSVFWFQKGWETYVAEFCDSSCWTATKIALDNIIVSWLSIMSKILPWNIYFQISIISYQQQYFKELLSSIKLTRLG